MNGERILVKDFCIEGSFRSHVDIESLACEGFNDLRLFEDFATAQ